MPEPAGLPARIAYVRCRLGWTQEELARALKVDAVSIYRWEKGLLTPQQR
jgi:DNA-binding XRE family transcriptional regulator